MKYYQIPFIHLAFLICSSCFTKTENKKQFKADSLIYLEDSVLFNQTTYYFDTCNTLAVDYIKTTFQGKNIGQDSIMIQCIGDIMTSPSSQWIPPKTSFHIDAKYNVIGKQGTIQQNFRAIIYKQHYQNFKPKTLDAPNKHNQNFKRIVLIYMKGYAIRENIDVKTSKNSQ